jgi:hypothetical protein
MSFLEKMYRRSFFPLYYIVVERLLNCFFCIFGISMGSKKYQLSSNSIAKVIKAKKWNVSIMVIFVKIIFREIHLHICKKNSTFAANLLF